MLFDRSGTPHIDCGRRHTILITGLAHGPTRWIDWTDTVLVWNIACGRQPRYELPKWVEKLDSGLLGHVADASENPYGDDRFARALDKRYAADRASMVTDIALRVIETAGVDLSELQNESTTVKSYGRTPGKTATGLYFTQGHSKVTVDINWTVTIVDAKPDCVA